MFVPCVRKSLNSTNRGNAMQTQSYMHVRKVGYVRGQLRNKISFDRLPAVKESSADDGTVLLKPLPAAPPAGHAVTDVKPVKRATVQSATKPKVHTQASDSGLFHHLGKVAYRKVS